jgi:hypothetical protein
MIKEVTRELALPQVAQPLPIPEPLSELLAATVQFRMIEELTFEVAPSPSAQPAPIPEP